jgi:murein L,D-transpeptidase YafK
MIDSSSTASTAASAVLPPFVREQLQFSRVRHARDVATSSIEDLFRRRGISYPASEMFIRVFKRERELELWVRSANRPRFELLRTYPVCALAGVLGPKRVEGDGQVPEGFYTIDLFNPASSYHLSLRIDYPNERDRAAAPEERALGGQIFIHGGCKSDGCLAITDEAIRELYWLAVTIRGRGQERIPVHIFPARFDNAWRTGKVERVFRESPGLLEFWETLRPAYDYFEKTHQLPIVGVDLRGRYRTSQ